MPPSPLHLTSKLPGASSLLRDRCIINSVWKILEVQINWDCWSSYRVSLLLSFLQPFSNSTTGVSSFCPLVGWKYLHLTLPAACWVFGSVVMLGLFLWVLHNLSDQISCDDTKIYMATIYTLYDKRIFIEPRAFSQIAKMLEKMQSKHWILTSH